jgi:hypothetical protein
MLEHSSRQKLDMKHGGNVTIRILQTQHGSEHAFYSGLEEDCVSETSGERELSAVNGG